HAVRITARSVDGAAEIRAGGGGDRQRAGGPAGDAAAAAGPDLAGDNQLLRDDGECTARLSPAGRAAGVQAARHVDGAGRLQAQALARAAEVGATQVPVDEDVAGNGDLPDGVAAAGRDVTGDGDRSGRVHVGAQGRPCERRGARG